MQTMREIFEKAKLTEPEKIASQNLTSLTNCGKFGDKLPLESPQNRRQFTRASFDHCYDRRKNRGVQIAAKIARVNDLGLLKVYCFFIPEDYITRDVTLKWFSLFFNPSLFARD